jgi:ankyrin repeat protein
MLSVHARFLKAAKEGDMVTIEELFAHSSADRDFVDLGDSLNRTPLYWAAANGHVETVKYLLDKGCNPAKADDNQRNAMYWARINKHWDVYKVLKDRNNSEF